MTDTELATLAVRLRQLMDEWGPEAARAAFAKQAAALDPQAREWLEARVFGVVGGLLDYPLPDHRGPVCTICGGRL